MASECTSCEVSAGDVEFGRDGGKWATRLRPSFHHPVHTERMPDRWCETQRGCVRPCRGVIDTTERCQLQKQLRNVRDSDMSCGAECCPWHVSPQEGSVGQAEVLSNRPSLGVAFRARSKKKTALTRRFGTHGCILIILLMLFRVGGKAADLHPVENHPILDMDRLRWNLDGRRAPWTLLENTDSP